MNKTAKRTNRVIYVRRLLGVQTSLGFVLDGCKIVAFRNVCDIHYFVFIFCDAVEKEKIHKFFV